MDSTSFVYFVVITALLVVSPGPNSFLIAKTVPTSGKQAGFCNVLGFVSAVYLHGILSILGISIILTQSQTAFDIVKYLGAAYLFWIGANSIYSVFFKENKIAAKSDLVARKDYFKAYLEGLLTNAFNPKLSMFYLAAFPHFINGEEMAFTSIFSLVVVHSVIVHRQINWNT